MRNVLLPVMAWIGALQTVGGSLIPRPTSLDQTAQLVGLASVLGTLTVLVYRLGVWRQQMEHTRDNVSAEVKAHREESTANFDRLERRLEAIDHLVSTLVEQRARTARWQLRADRRLDRLEKHVEVE